MTIQALYINVTLRCISITVVAIEKQVCVYSGIFSAQYCDLCPVWLNHIFPHDPINGMIFEKKKTFCTQNVFFDFFYKFCLKHFSF